MNSLNITEKVKIFQDPIYGSIGMDALCVAIIDTPEFQRLRRIKQLGTSNLVYAGGNHTRFEHSMGTAHLAELLITTIRTNQPELKIDDSDVLCIKMAGLCHDLGHGPFSHTFDLMFRKSSIKWKHEIMSQKILRKIFSHPTVNTLASKFGITDKHVDFACQLINPSKNDTLDKKEKSFMYEIVSNTKSGLDVDKFDYILRDCYYVGIKCGFDYKRYMGFCRVVNVEGYNHICLRDKMYYNLYEVFSLRHYLHFHVYQHKMSIITDYMIIEAMKLADKFITFSDNEGKLYSISETINNTCAFIKLNDSVYDRIRWSDDENVGPARKILEAIENRNMYKFVHEWLVDSDVSVESIKQAIIEKTKNVVVDEENLIILKHKLDYGKGEENPIDKIHFYSKYEPNSAKKLKKEHVSRILPQNFSDCKMMVFLKVNDKCALQAVYKVIKEIEV